MKLHSAANFVRQIHVVNSFVKPAPEQVPKDQEVLCNITSPKAKYLFQISMANS